MLAAIHATGQPLKRLYNQALALILPPTCIACHTHLPAQEPVAFCPACYAKLPWWNTSQVLPPTLPKPLASFAAPCLYEEPLRATLLALKFHDQTHTIPALIRLLLPLIPAIPGLVVIAVPSHPSRLRQRTYNHAALLAEALAKRAKLAYFPTALKRLKPSLPQNSKTRAQRLKLSGTDFLATPAVQGKTILLIDDIFTTGATARACALALKRVGATAIHVRTLAYTKPE